MEEIFKQLKLFRFPVQRGHRCRERFGKLEILLILLLQNLQKCCCLPTAEGPEKLVCFDRRRGILTVELWLTGKAALFLLY